MKIKESKSDQFGTYITGLTYTGILAIILLLFCFLINNSWFDYTLTTVLLVVICITFFVSGFKKVSEKKLGFLIEFGKRNFDKYFSEGWWWVFPLWSFKQIPHFKFLNKGEEIQVKYITSDEIPLDLVINYYWMSKNPEDIDNKYSPSFIKNTLEYELGKFVRNRHAIELLSDETISNKIMVDYLKKTGENIGIVISDIFPNINYENQYIPVVRKYQEKYKDLKFQLDQMLMHQQIKTSDMKIYENQILNCIKNIGFNQTEAMNFIKVYKNQMNMSESTYNIGDLNKIIESVISVLTKK